MRSKKLGGIGAGILVLGLSLAVWALWQPLLAWYSTRALAQAGEAERDLWVERVARLDTDALPGLLRCLRRSDPRACTNARLALACLAKRWGPSDSRVVDLANRLSESLAELSFPGQRAALELQAVLVQPVPSGAVVKALVPVTARLLAQAAQLPDREVRAQAMSLAAQMLDQVEREEVLAGVRELTRACLRDHASTNRIQAVRLALRPELALLEQVVPLLEDPLPEVRRIAMLAVGPAEDTMRTDSLLRWLHDSDAEVRKLCEKALRSRGLSEEHLKLGRLITDARPRTRLQVLEILPRANDLEPGVWLRHLSHDPEPAVRAAALRAAGEQPALDLTDRMGQMAANDPSATVRQLARHYLSLRKGRLQSGPSTHQ